MQQNSSQWLRRMREKHRRIFGIRESEVQVQVQQVQRDRVQEREDRIGQVLLKGDRTDQVLQIGGRTDHMLLKGDQNSLQNGGSHSVSFKNNVIPLEQKRSSSGSKPLPPTIAELEADVWELRKQFILQIANRRNGKVRLQDVAAECNVNIRIAAEWLIRLSMEGMLSLVAGQRYTMTYLVKELGGAQK